MNVDLAPLVIDGFKWVLASLAAGGVGLLCWFMKCMNGRTSRLEQELIPRSEVVNMHMKLHDKLGKKVDEQIFRDYMDRAEIVRQEMRTGQANLFQKLDDLKTMLLTMITQHSDKNK